MCPPFKPPFVFFEKKKACIWFNYLMRLASDRRRIEEGRISPMDDPLRMQPIKSTWSRSVNSSYVLVKIEMRLLMILAGNCNIL